MLAESANETQVTEERHEELDYHWKNTRNPASDTL